MRWYGDACRAAAFAFGLATMLALLGVGSSLLGRTYGQFGSGAPIAVSLVAILMGLNLLEVVQLRLPSLDVDVRQLSAPPLVQVQRASLLAASLKRVPTLRRCTQRYRRPKVPLCSASMQMPNTCISWHLPARPHELCVAPLVTVCVMMSAMAVMRVAGLRRSSFKGHSVKVGSWWRRRTWPASHLRWRRPRAARLFWRRCSRTWPHRRNPCLGAGSCLPTPAGAQLPLLLFSAQALNYLAISPSETSAMRSLDCMLHVSCRGIWDVQA